MCRFGDDSAEKWNDSLLIGEPDAAGHYSFTAQADSTSDQKALAAMKDSLGSYHSQPTAPTSAQ